MVPLHPARLINLQGGDVRNTRGQFSSNNSRPCYFLPRGQDPLALMHSSWFPAATQKSVSSQTPADLHGLALSEPLQENLQCRDGDLVGVCPLSANNKAVPEYPKGGSGLQKDLHNNLAHRLSSHTCSDFWRKVLLQIEKLSQWVFANCLFRQQSKQLWGFVTLL